MALKQLDLTEDRDFQDGETIYDVDANAYTVKNGRAVLKRGSSSVSYFLGRTMRLCFTRTVPPVIRCAKCGITVFASSDNKTGLCTGCEKWEAR